MIGQDAWVWIMLTLAAAAFQIARTSEQHRLRSVLGVAEASYVRFVYALPIALTLTTAWMLGPGQLSTPGPRFWVSVLLGGSAQILATMALLQSFRLRDFTVGILYAKSEILFVGIGTALFLGEPLSSLSWLGMAICLVGVLSLATTGGKAADYRLDPAAWFGIAAAIGFAGAALGIRSAASSLEGSAVDRAALTLTAMLALQTLLQGAGLASSKTASLRAVRRAWRQSLGVAVLSLAGSAGWALAMTLENAAKVRTLGQIELVFAFVIGIVVHHEVHTKREYVSSGLAVAGIALIVIS